MADRMRVEWRGVDELRPYPGNPRCNDAAVEAIAAARAAE